MKKKARDPLKNIQPKLLSISCILLLLIMLISFTAVVEDTNVSDNISINNKANADNKISVQLSSKITETSSTEEIPVIIMLTNQNIAFNSPNGESQIESEQSDIINVLKAAKSENEVQDEEQDIKSIKLVNAVATNITPDVIALMANRPEVSKIELDEIIYIVPDQKLSSEETNISANMQDLTATNTWGVNKIGAPAVWQKGINGDGIIVAVVDTGVDAQHPDLDDLDNNANTNDPKVIGWIDYVNSYSSPYDDHGHGTHVAGTISGTGANGMQTGVAPGAKLIAAKVFDASGRGYTSNIILGFEWAVNHNARILSYSGGASSHQTVFKTAINNAVAAGVIPVIAAGNSGPGSSTICCPGDETNSITVGATDSSDTIASFSSRGPVTLDGSTYIKPDVSAPGVSVTSTLPNGAYASWSGTSMATPHVSGTVALMLANNPALTLQEVKQTLEGTAVDLGTAGKDKDYGSGRIDAYKAVFGTGTQNPIADFSAVSTSGNAPLSVLFIDKSTGSQTSWYWEFGDGTYSTDTNPTHTYSVAGTYSVKLTVRNNAGENSVVKSGYISVTQDPNKPVVSFVNDVSSGNRPLAVQFTDTSTQAPTKWSWSFGDGATSTVQSPAHTYTKAGTYSVRLTVSNSAGSSTITKNSLITVAALKRPVAAFSGSPTSGTTPLSVSFTDMSTGSPTAWRWSFGDGQTSTQQNPVHAYSKAGRYAVSLTATNAAGSNSVSKSSYVNAVAPPRAPVAAFSGSGTSGRIPLSVSFTDRSTNTPTSWNWDFGDGTSSTEKNPVHTYSQAGTYTVILTASNAAGSNTVTRSRYITVTMQRPVAAFSGSPTSGMTSLNVLFTDRSTGSPTSYRWTFGDGTSSTEKNPVHTYSKAGRYTVVLTTTNAAGSSTVTRSRYVTVRSR